MFGEINEHNTQETYLGHNMADAIACYQNGRWPTGLEVLERILGRQGNLVTIDDMFMIMQYDSSLYNTVRKKCHAVRTCQPNPDHEHGGCTRQVRPGCQTFNSNIENDRQAFFARGTGSKGVCNDCPIASEAGLTENEDRAAFRGKTLELGVHRFNRITTTDVLLLDYQRPVGGAPKILLGERRHILKFNKPSGLQQDSLLDMFSCLAMETEPRIDVDNGMVFVDAPFISQTSDVSDLESIYEVKNDDRTWDISIANFSPKRIRYFVGSIDPSQALHKFVERVPRGKLHDQRVRLRVEDSLLVWLPTPSGAPSESPSWEGRIGQISLEYFQGMLEDVNPNHVFLSVIDRYPGVFLFVKNSKEMLLKTSIYKFLKQHGQIIDRRMLIPQFVQDVDSIRFLWDGTQHPGQTLDDGGKPEFLLEAGRNLDLLTQISRKSSVMESGGGDNHSIAYPSVEIYIFEHVVGNKPIRYPINAKVKPNDFGFAWMSLKFSKPGQYHLCIINTGDKRQRWIQVVVLGDEVDGSDFSYYTQGDGYQSIDSGKAWGPPPQDQRNAVLQFNNDQLLQGLQGLDEIVDIATQQGHLTLQLGHVAEIARLIFHQHSTNLHEQQTMQLGTFESRLRAITYNIQALYGSEVNSEHNLMRYLRALGEFEYWVRAEGYENNHKLIMRTNLFGSWTDSADSSLNVVNIVDARPSRILREVFPSLHVDWESGIRFVDTDDLLQLDFEPNGEKCFVLHPNETRIAPSPDVFLRSFWGAVRQEAAPLPPANGWSERRWNPSMLAGNGAQRATIPANRKRISDTAERLSRGRKTPEWVKRNKWHEITSIQVSVDERLFLSLRYSDLDDFDVVNWEMWLGCLNNRTMTECFILLATRQSNDEDQPWIDELGNIGTEGILSFPWLSDPKNSLFDPTYLMREIARSIATIAERVREERIPQTNPLSNRGLPGWIFSPHVSEIGLIETRVAALSRYLGDDPASRELSEGDIGMNIRNKILRRFGWGIVYEN